MSNVLSDEEMKKLADIGKKIKMSLECNINEGGVPCRTDRLSAVKLMKEYLEIHDYKVVDLNE